jgi:hypothetical protein
VRCRSGSVALDRFEMYPVPAPPKPLRLSSGSK